jgi:hypothetical protein
VIAIPHSARAASPASIAGLVMPLLVRPLLLLPLLMFPLLLPVGAAAAQPPADRLAGVVTLDGAPVPGVDVTLHRVDRDTSGAVASATTNAGGAFAFDLPPADTSGFTVYFATADYLSVRYFGEPVHPGDAPEPYRLQVRDTTSAGEALLRVARRDLVLVPHADGGWEVNEVVRLRNTGSRTVVSSRGMPSWRMSVPSGAEEFEAGAGDLQQDQVVSMGDELMLLAPIQPGEREIFLRYRVPPSGEAQLAIGTPVDSMNVFVQQPSPGVTVSGLRPVELITVEGQRFLRMSAAELPADSTLTMEWASSAPPVDPVWAGVGVAGLLVLVGAGAAARNRSR